MSLSSKLQVMISSRCLDNFPETNGKPLSEIRKELKREIEDLEIFGRKVFEVWISEETDPQGGTWDSWEVCIQAAKDCHILIAISNGHAGNLQNEGGIGICHAELMNALSRAPAKVRLVALPNVTITQDAAGERNRRFQDYVARQNLFRGGVVMTIDELKTRVKEAVYDALVRLAQAGVRDASKGKFHSGEALDWSRLDFRHRAEEMKRVVSDVIVNHPGSVMISDNLLAKMDDIEVLVVPHAIPAALTVGAAKEMVGQPFLQDHLYTDVLTEDRGGPVHVIACHKTATEQQAMKLLGVPDATVVSPPFGIFVADNIQKVQFAFIVNCRDESTTRYGIQRFLEWLSREQEDKLVAKRAQARARIVRVIAEELRS